MSKPIVLIVDDEPANLTVLAHLLAGSYMVRACKTGRHALEEAARKPHPDLILLDVLMPEMDGYTVLARLRNNPVTREIPVIFVTALGEAMDEENGLLLGAVDYITKPIKTMVALARIQVHIEVKQARDRLQSQNVWLEAEVARRMSENLLIQDASLAAMAQLAETRDSDLGNHIARTQAYVEVLARRLQSQSSHARELPELTLARIVKAAPLHDIGKIGIPDHILLKPGKLTAEEWEVMQSHSRIGGDTITRAIAKVSAQASGLGTTTLASLPRPSAFTPEEWASMQQHCQDDREKGVRGGYKPESLAFLEVARDIAACHHEKWDGSGYPEKLAGAAIPLAARLMALADVFDALTTPRVYKKPWTTAEAVDFIRSQSGLHFDPQVVEAFIAVVDEFTAIQQRLADSDCLR